MGTPEERAALIRELIHKSQTTTDSMVTILGSFDHRLSALQTAMRPTQITTHSIRRAHENIGKTLKVAEVILGQFDLARKAEAKILRGPHEDSESYLEGCDQLRSIVRTFSGKNNLKSSVGVITYATTLLANSIIKLEDDFQQLLTSYSKPVEPDCLFECLPQSLLPSTASPNPHEGSGTKEHQTKNLKTAGYDLPDLIPSRILLLLHDLAQLMIRSGHQQQAFNIYRNIRSAFVEQSLRKLGVERLSKEDVQKMQWEVLEAKIENWIHFMRISVNLLFAAEKRICDEIFHGHDALREQCFAEVTAKSAAVLLSIGEAIAKSKRSPEKLFVLLDMYEIMTELHPQIDIIFGSKYFSEMRQAALVLTKRLAQTAKNTLAHFEEAVEKDATKTIVDDGTVHPLTSYVINYVKFLFDYRSTLTHFFLEFDGGDAKAHLADLVTRILQALQSNLDGKSNQYKDPALTELFMMNNIHYIVRSVRMSEAKDLLGNDWVQIHRRVVQQHAKQYRRISWSKILKCLSIQGLSSAGNTSFKGQASPGSSSTVSRAMLKDKYKTFNASFEELHQRQSQWTIPDSELRESLRLAVAEVLLPAFRSFNKRFGPMIESGKNPQKYMKYTPEDLERMLAEFFEGKL
nr:exocyst complex component EXO70A1-like isoform X1 [Ipomoea trifida]